MHIVSLGDNLHEMHNFFSGKDTKNVSKCRLLKFLPNMLSTIFLQISEPTFCHDIACISFCFFLYHSTQ